MVIAPNGVPVAAQRLVHKLGFSLNTTPLSVEGNGTVISHTQK